MIDFIVMVILTIFIFDLGMLVGKLGLKRTIEEFRKAIFE